MIYFHGTSTLESAKSIYKDKLLKAPTHINRDGFNSIQNHIYLTSNFNNVIPYIIGESKEDCGYLFIVNCNDLYGNLLPDEDNVGYLLYDVIKHGQGEFKWLLDIAIKVLTKQEIDKNSKSFYFRQFAISGKKIIPYLDTDQKEKIIYKFSNIAHCGNVKWSECFKFNKNNVTWEERIKITGEDEIC